MPLPISLLGVAQREFATQETDVMSWRRRSSTHDRVCTIAASYTVFRIYIPVYRPLA
jgi:hypothetical protein